MSQNADKPASAMSNDDGLIPQNTTTYSESETELTQPHKSDDDKKIDNENTPSHAKAHAEPKINRVTQSFEEYNPIMNYGVNSMHNYDTSSQTEGPLDKPRTPITRKLTWSGDAPPFSMNQYGCMPIALSHNVEPQQRSNRKLTKLSRDTGPQSIASDGSQIKPQQIAQSKGNSEDNAKSTKFLLILYTLGMLTSSVINSLYFKKMTSAMPNYSAFLNQATSVIYIPLFGFVCLYLYSTYGADGLGGSAVVAFPLYKFAAMGILDGAGSVLMMIGGTYTTGSSQVVLSQTVIPVTLFTCYLALNRKYHHYQYIGALVIMLGVAVTKMKSAAAPESASLNTSDKLSYNLVFMASTIPAAFSALYKELAFNDVEMNVNYMQFWVALWQFVVGFCLVPMQSLPILGPQRVPISEMPESMKDGLLCLVTGHNSIVTNCGGPNQPQCDNCGDAWLPVLNYCLANIAYNVFSLLVVKHGGATISFLVSTLRLPLTTICFSSVWIMGRGNTTTPTIFDFAGLAVLFIGLCTYRYGSLMKSRSLPSGMRQVHLYTTTLDADPIIMTVPKTGVKSATQLRHQLYNRLPIVDPLLNPETRAMYTQYTPPKIPDHLSDFLPDTMLQRYNTRPQAPSLSGTSMAVAWDPDVNRANDAESICSSRSKDHLSDIATGPRQSQRQRWLQQLANKYGDTYSHTRTLTKENIQSVDKKNAL